MDNYKKPLISWLKAQRDFFAGQPVLYVDEWLSFAQELQRRINDTFRVTACQVALRFSNIFDGKAVDIEVWRKKNPEDAEFSIFKCVTLQCEHNKLPVEIDSQRTLLNKFIDSLIEEL